MNIVTITTGQGRRDLKAALSNLVSWNCYLMRTRALPLLYESGIRYVREDEENAPWRKQLPDVERWQAADVLAITLKGDCEDLACYLVAELRVKRHERARIRLTKKGTTWHVSVFRGNGRVEDPSRRLGMGAS